MDFERIMVPVGGTGVDGEALKLAASLSGKGKTKIRVIYVITLNRSLPVDAEVESEIRHGEDILNHLETAAEQLKMDIETDLLQAREPGPVIVEEALKHNIDLIVMGVEYKQRLGQFSLGSVVPYVLKNAPCRVILFQQSTRT